MFFRKKSSGPKIKATKTNGFASKLENSVHEILLKRQADGEIKDIRIQHTYEIVKGLRWKVDFSFEDCATGQRIYCEAKGFPTDVYKLKLRMYKIHGKHRLEIWKGSYKKPVLVEIIEPEGLCLS